MDELEYGGFASGTIGVLVAAMQDGTREWRHNLEGVPEGFAHWRPCPGGVTAGAIVLHMAACERWWIDGSVLGTEVDRTDTAVAYDLTMDQYDGIYPDPPMEDWAWFMATFDKHRARTVETLMHEADPKRVLRSSRGEEYTVEWVVGHILQHDSYHGGQIVLLKTLFESASR